MILSMIYAVSENGVIGRDNDIPWRIPADLKRFKAITMGKPIIMGRKTWESLGRPLPGRRNIVITRQLNYQAEGADVCASLEEAIALCKDQDEACLIGGATLYKEAWEKELVSAVFQTLVHAEIEGDTFLDLPLDERFSIKNVDAHQADDRNEFAYTYLDWA
ncbi:MAG: dihydrofolate reductase [Bacteroidia bacterium]